jgi:hypothetical protein
MARAANLVARGGDDAAARCALGRTAAAVLDEAPIDTVEAPVDAVEAAVDLAPRRLTSITVQLS